MIRLLGPGNDLYTENGEITKTGSKKVTMTLQNVVFRIILLSM